MRALAGRFRRKERFSTQAHITSMAGLSLKLPTKSEILRIHIYVILEERVDTAQRVLLSTGKIRLNCVRSAGSVSYYCMRDNFRSHGTGSRESVNRIACGI